MICNTSQVRKCVHSCSLFLGPGFCVAAQYRPVGVCQKHKMRENLSYKFTFAAEHYIRYFLWVFLNMSLTLTIIRSALLCIFGHKATIRTTTETPKIKRYRLKIALVCNSHSHLKPSKFFYECGPVNSCQLFQSLTKCALNTKHLSLTLGDP